MADASVVQSSFLGGEWSPYAQGRIDEPSYKMALNVCLNSFPLQEGAWTRRGGWIEQGVTLHNRDAIVRPFILPNNQPAYLEMAYDSGASYLTVWVSNGTQGFKRLTETAVNVTTVSTATPAVLQTATATAWSTGDWVVFNLGLIGDNASATGNLGNNRALQITKVNTTHFSLYDDVSGADIIGADLAYAHVTGDTVARVLVLDLPYTTLADLQSVRVVQADYMALLLCRGYPPQAIYYNSSSFTIADAGSTLWDGPYVDPFPGLSQQGTSLGAIGDPWGSLSPTSTTTFTVSDSAYTFTSADIGKPIRMYWQPPAWDMTADYTSASPTTYTQVTFSGSYWAIGNEFMMPTGTQPGSSYTYNDNGHQIVFVPWNPVPNAAGFTTGYITGVSSGSTVDVQLTSLFLIPPTMRGDPPQTIDLWQIGVYGPSQYPACGCYHEGRLWLGGAVQNRFDGSVSDALDILKVARASGTVPSDAFSPTDVYGNVGDANAIAAVLNDKELNWIYWIEPGAQGMVAGTPGGEFLISASNLNDPLTPTTTQAHKVTKYKVANAEPRLVGGALLFIQAFGRRVMEYFADAFTGKFLARHLNENAGHLSQQGIVEIAYQEERTPILWARRSDGIVIGCTYRRFSNFSSQPAEFTAWHHHAHGAGMIAHSICVGPSPAGQIDCLMGILFNASTNLHNLAMMAPVFEESYLMPQAGHVDGVVGYVAHESGSGGGSGPGIFGFEVTADFVSNTNECSALMGIANSSYDIDNRYGLDHTSGPHTPTLDGGLFLRVSETGANGWSGGTAGLGNFGAGSYLGTTVQFIVDTVNHLIWARSSLDPTFWIGSGPGSPDPETGTLGFDYTNSAIGSSDNIFILCGISQWGDGTHLVFASLTLNAGASSFVMALPSVAMPWDTSGITVLNAADAGPDLSLSGGNLSLTSGIISGSNQPGEYIRSTTSKIS